MDTTDRVRELLAASGLTQRAFAEKVGIEPTKLSKSLNGARRFSSLDLALLAEAGGVTVDWLLTGSDTPVAMAARVSAAASSADRAISKALEYTTMRSDLSTLGYKQEWRLPEGVALRGRLIDQGAALAEKATAMIRESGRSVRESLASVIEEVFGVDVAVQELGEGFDGLAAATASARLILVDASTMTSRQRFTMAHELGHLLASDDQKLHSDQNIYGDDSRRGEGEMRANAFAAALLMPEPEVREWVAGRRLDLETLCALASDFAVSPSALGYRLHNLHMIDLPTREQFRVLTSKAAARRAGRSETFAQAAADAMTPKTPRSLLRDTFRAFEDGQATLRPYAQLLGVDPRTLRAELADCEVAQAG